MGKYRRKPLPHEKTGPKELVEGDPASRTVPIKLNHGEWSGLRAAAAAEGVKQSAYVRQLVRADVQRKRGI